MRKVIFFIISGILLSGCYNMELVTEHGNPLDRIFDDGNFRIVLNRPERQSDGTWLIRWSNVFHRKEGELDDEVFRLSAGAALASMDSAPSATDLEAIKNNSVNHDFDTEIVQIRARNGSYAGSHNLGDLSSVTIRSYVIYMSYNYTDPDDKISSGVIHSNVVVFEQ